MTVLRGRDVADDGRQGRGGQASTNPVERSGGPGMQGHQEERQGKEQQGKEDRFQHVPMVDVIDDFHKACALLWVEMSRPAVWLLERWLKWRERRG